jgi:hypothetical protein
MLEPATHAICATSTMVVKQEGPEVDVPRRDRPGQQTADRLLVPSPFKFIGQPVTIDPTFVRVCKADSGEHPGNGWQPPRFQVLHSDL